MYTPGMNAAFHDPAACLVKDGQVLAAAEEERFPHLKRGKRFGPALKNIWFQPACEDAGTALGEPILCSPRDAVECFWTSPVGALVIGPYLLVKSGEPV